MRELHLRLSIQREIHVRIRPTPLAPAMDDDDDEALYDDDDEDTEGTEIVAAKYIPRFPSAEGTGEVSDAG